MKVRKYTSLLTKRYGYEEMELSTAIEREISNVDVYERGELERLREHVDNLTNALAALINQLADKGTLTLEDVTNSIVYIDAEESE